jgi:hypothetical protein
MNKRRSLLAAVLFGLCLFSAISDAAIPVTTIWEIRTDGNDQNGGGFDATVPNAGTDYSLQGAAQKTFTNLLSQGINAPAAPALSTNNMGGSLTPKLYQVKLTYLTAGGGETLPGTNTNITVPAGTNTNTITVTSPSAQIGVVAYKVWVKSQGGFSPYWLQNDAVDGTSIGTNFVLTTALTTGDNPPGSNTAQIKVKSTSPAFAATDIGNLLNVYGGGASWLNGRYLVLAYDAGTGYVTLDRLVSTTVNNNGGDGKLGGALATPDELMIFANPSPAPGSTIWVRGGTYSSGAGWQLTTSGLDTKPNRFVGYGTTRGDGGAPVLSMTSGTGSILSVGGDFWIVQNFVVDGNQDSDITPAGFHINGDCNLVENVTAIECPTNGVITGYGNKLRVCEFSLSVSGSGLRLDSNFDHVQSTLIEYCVIAANSGAGVECATGPSTIRFCTIYGNGGDGIATSALKYGAVIQNCVIWDNALSGILIDTFDNSIGGGPGLSIENNIIGDNGGYSLESITSFGPTLTLNTWAGLANFGNAYYVGSGVAISDGFIPLEASYITLTTDPFIASGSADFRLNNTAGGGAAITGSSLRNVTFLNHANNTTHTTTGITE